MTATTLAFEIKAAVFERITGHLAPGKDAPADGLYSRESRERAWREWNDKYGAVVSLTIDQCIRHFDGSSPLP